MDKLSVVRRIDNLGRIVIPKDIRKGMNIHDGELLELVYDGSMLILKKVSSLADMKNLFKLCISLISNFLNLNILVTNLDNVVEVDDTYKDKFCGKIISKDYFELINSHSTYLSTGCVDINLVLDEKFKCYYYFVPILVYGDSIGSLFIFSEKRAITSGEISIINQVVNLIREYLEN